MSPSRVVILVNNESTVHNNEMKNDPRSYDRNFCNCVKKPEKKKIQDFNGA